MGTVTSNPSGISCTGACSGSFLEDTVVTLTATPAIGFFFLGWSGPCTGVGACSVTIGDTVKIVVSALLADKRKLSEATCREIRSWPSVDAGSYEGKKDASFPLTGLGKLGLSVLQMDVVPAKGPPPGGSHHPYANFIAYCSCESTRDELNPSIGILGYPDAEKCTEIGKCGHCCRISLP